MSIYNEITVKEFVDAIQKSSFFSMCFHLGKGNRLCSKWMYGLFHDAADDLAGGKRSKDSTQQMCDYLDNNRTAINAEIKSRL